MFKQFFLKKLKEKYMRRMINKDGTPKYVPKHINASDIYKCPREIYYKMTGASPEGLEDNQWMNLEQGIVYHEMLQQFFGVENQAEKRFLNKELNLACRPDGILVLEDKVSLLIEIKPSNWRSWGRLNTLEDIKRYKPNYYWQWQVTSFVTGYKEGTMIFYLPDTSKKDVDKLKEFRITQDIKDVNLIKKKCRMINRALKSGKLPPCDETKCMYCSYKKKCKEERGK